MRWPWQKPETRSYTDTIVSAYLASATGGLNDAPLETGALEIAAGIYSRCLAAAEVDGPEAFKRALTPSFLAQVGRDLIRAGNSYHLIKVGRDGTIKLLPQSSVTVVGQNADSDSWVYISSENGPSASVQRTVRSREMIHFMTGVSRQRPWEGQPPWAFAKSTSGAIAGLEKILSREANAPHGSVMGLPESPVVDDAETVKPLEGFRNDLGTAKGRTLLVESPSQWQGGAPGTTKGSGVDITPFGFDRSLIDALRTATGRDVLSACGVPLGLIEGSGDGTKARESYRQWLHGSLRPIARLIEQELSEKFETDIRLDFNGLHAADVAGRSRAFKQLTEAGLTKEEAAINTGITLDT